MVDVRKDQLEFDFVKQNPSPLQQKQKGSKSRAHRQIMSPEESARILGIKPPSAYRQED